MIETNGLSLKEFQGEKEIQLVVLVIKKTEIGEYCHSNAYVAIGNVELREINGNEINKVYDITVENTVNQIADTASHNEKKCRFHRKKSPVSGFRYLQVF